MASSTTQNMSAKVLSLKSMTSEVLGVTICSNTPDELPQWTPGYHVDILSQYGKKMDAGGSKWLHENLREGMDVTVRRPKNHFRLRKRPRYILLAGGIDITPLTPMLSELKCNGADYHLIYLGRPRGTMAYVEELCRGHPTEVWTSQDGKGFDLESFVKAQEKNVQIYCCGPDRLINALEDACRENVVVELRVERFQVASTRNFCQTKASMSLWGVVEDD
ncbi:hypothetical protein COH20_009206 [Aspergillus flavus]|nr:hypothetical protein COH20_009206 [Aspergillus flavus]RAQ62407.1 hypothetical protein COH21_011702 [Aspergillus flavus]